MNYQLNRSLSLRGFVVLLGLLAWFFAEAQDIPRLERKVTIQSVNRPLEEVMKEIEKKADLTFSYPSTLLDLQSEVNCSHNHKPVRIVLAGIFGPSITVRERGKYIILSSNSASDKRDKLSGYVVDNTGQGVPGVTVFDPATLVSSTTNEFGFYEMKVDPISPPVRIEVRKADYLDQTIQLPVAGRMIETLEISQDTTWHRRWVMRRDTLLGRFSRLTGRVFLSKPEMQNVNDTIYRNFQLSLAPFVGTNRKLCGQVINAFSINVFGGYARGVDGFEIGGLVNMLGGNMHGAQIAGAANFAGGEMNGVQVAGIASVVEGAVDGVTINGAASLMRSGGKGVSVSGLVSISDGDWKGTEVAGFASITHGNHQGVQVSGIANVATGQFEGVQLTGFLNVAAHEIKGSQVAGVTNVAAQKSHGAQVSGFANVAADSHKGAQVSGFMNLTVGDQDGAQISGFINISRAINGIQFGVFNYCDTTSRASIGFLSFVKKGYHPIEIAMTDQLMTELSWRTGLRKYYTFISGGFNPFDEPSRRRWTFGYGLGASPRLSEKTHLNIELSAHHFSVGRFSESMILDSRFGVYAEYRISRRIAVFGGPCLHGFIDRTNAEDFRPLAGATDRPLSVEEYGTLRFTSWLGWKAGLRLF